MCLFMWKLGSPTEVLKHLTITQNWMKKIAA